MPDYDMKALLDLQIIWENVINIAIASIGGFARLLNASKMRKYRLSPIMAFVELFVAGFTGYASLSAARMLNAPPASFALISCMAGWTAPLLLYAFTGMVEKIFRIDEGTLSDKKKPEENKDKAQTL